ncbi:MAG: hypothetical protein ACREHV_15460 [Rhizomicrobium sp.]
MAEETKPCPWCGGAHHQFNCPRVKAFEFDSDMKIRRVEFLTLAECLARRDGASEGNQDEYPKIKPMGGRG